MTDKAENRKGSERWRQNKKVQAMSKDEEADRGMKTHSRLPLLALREVSLLQLESAFR